MGLERNGFECVGWVESDPFCSKCKKITKHLVAHHNFTYCQECETLKRQNARFSYEAIYNTENEWTAYDITSVTTRHIRLLEQRGVDLICGGFPCQSFSIGGNRGGFLDTRGTMFFEIAKFVQRLQPSFLLLENVKGLLSHDGGWTFGIILNTLAELGYDAEWEVLNSKDFSTTENPTPQNRERIFIVGHLGGLRGKVFPLERNCTTTKIKTIGNLYNGGQAGDVLDPTGISSCLDAMQGGNRMPKVYYTSPPRIKKLSPRECWKLQGFPNYAFEKASAVNVASALYKQSGNSVCVNVSEAIGRKLKELI